MEGRLNYFERRRAVLNPYHRRVDVLGVDAVRLGGGLEINSIPTVALLPLES